MQIQGITVTRARDEAQRATTFTYTVSDALLDAQQKMLPALMDKVLDQIATEIANSAVLIHGQAILEAVNPRALASLVNVRAAALVADQYQKAANVSDTRTHSW